MKKSVKKPLKMKTVGKKKAPRTKADSKSLSMKASASRGRPLHEHDMHPEIPELKNNHSVFENSKDLNARESLLAHQKIRPFDKDKSLSRELRRSRSARGQ